MRIVKLSVLCILFSLTGNELFSQKINRFGWVSGIDLYKLNTSQNTNFKIPDLDFYFPLPETETGFIAGLTYERLLSKESEKLSLRLEFLFHRQTFYCYGIRKKINGNTAYDDTFFDFSAIKIPFMIQYLFVGRKIVPFINAGIAYQAFIKSDYLHIEEEATDYNEIITTEDRNIVFKPGEISFFGSIGGRIRIIDDHFLNLQLRFESGPGIFDNYNAGLPDYVVLKHFRQNSFQSVFLAGISF